MLNKLESTIQEILAASSLETAKRIGAAVRRALAEEIMSFTPKAVASAPQPKAAPVKTRGPGRPRKAAAAPTATAAARPAKKPARPSAKPARPKRKAAKFVRRSPEQIAKDNAKLLAFIAAHPGLRAEQIQKDAGMPKPSVASGLQALREAKRIKMTGIKRAATYRAA